jgi:dipeptidyl aminopeptidase/acylaminoacyl peptidase
MLRATTLAAAFGLLLSMPAIGVRASVAGGPTIDDLISLKRVGSPTISPDGHWVAFTVRETNWDADRYDTQLYLANVDTGAIRQITHAARSSNAPAWSPDGTRLAFASDRTDKRQIYVLDPTGGEAEAITSGDDSPGAFHWSPDGKTIAYTSTDPAPETLKSREKEFGQFEVIGEQHRMTHLHLLDVATHKTRTLTKGEFTVGSFDWSPDGTKIAFDHRINSDNANGSSADISIVSVGDGTVRALVTTAGPDTNPVWSPDGTQIAFETALANPSFFFTNTVVAVTPAAGGSITPLSKSFDEDPSIVAWRADGLYFSASARTNSYLYRLNPQAMQATKVLPADGWAASGFTIAGKSTAVAFVASNPTTYPELFVGTLAGGAPKKITIEGIQVAAWPRSTHEVVTWKSQDGASIEGVLHKPADFKAGQKYPLLVVIHGGPTGVSRPAPFGSTSTYPIDLWLNKGAIVLEPNYRGSAGYGEAFRSLNVRNLGVGDAWDVLSGIDALIAQGLVDPARVGAMGWSQGGYISAFLSTHDSARFKAISVGAGISDWMTYYVMTDITPFTPQYLKATPWDDPEIYRKTSPITYIKGAKTPTLIQHGATDQRVPPPDAYELYRGLLDQKVPTKLIIYRGFEGVGHGPSKPKSSRAVMTHNLEWFDQYFFGAK